MVNQERNVEQVGIPFKGRSLITRSSKWIKTQNLETQEKGKIKRYKIKQSLRKTWKFGLTCIMTIKWAYVSYIS